MGVLVVKIRLRRVGKRNRPSYRMVVAEVRSPRDGVVLDTLGSYDPLPDPPRLSLKEERARLWLNRGAQPTPAAARLLEKAGIRKEQAGNNGDSGPG